MNHIDPSHPDQRPHRPDERQAAAPRQAGADRIIPASCTPPHTAARRLLPTGTLRVLGSQGRAVHHVINVMGRVRSCTPLGAMPGYRAC